MDWTKLPRYVPGTVFGPDGRILQKLPPLESRGVEIHPATRLGYPLIVGTAKLRSGEPIPTELLETSHLLAPRCLMGFRSPAGYCEFSPQTPLPSRSVASAALAPLKDVEVDVIVGPPRFAMLAEKARFVWGGQLRYSAKDGLSPNPAMVGNGVFCPRWSGSRPEEIHSEKETRFKPQCKL